MGNNNSSRERRKRRRRPRHKAPRPVQEEYDDHKYENAAFEDEHRAERLSRARSLASEASNLKRFRVENWDVQNPGFKVDKVSLMILDVFDHSLQEKMLPPGSIIREIDRVPVYEYSQFRSHIENKNRFILSVLVPEITGIWKIRPNSQKRHIDVHRESLVVSTTTLHNFPKTPQVVLCVNGVPVRDYVEYEQLTHNKEKFYVSVTPARSKPLSDSSINSHLETLQHFPHKVTENELNLMLTTIQEALIEVKCELDLRAQVIPPREEEVIVPQYPPAPPAAAFSQTQVPHDIHVEQAAIGDDFQYEQDYEEQKQPTRHRKRKKKRKRKRNR